LLQKRARYGKFYHQHLRFLQKSQWNSNSQLDEIQFKRAKQFLIHAKHHCGFYRNLFHKYGFQPEKMQSLSALCALLPTLSKETVRSHLNKIVTDHLKEYKVRWSHTSGTTGTGLQFPLSSECFQRDYAFSSLHYL